MPRKLRSTFVFSGLSALFVVLALSLLLPLPQPPVEAFGVPVGGLRLGVAASKAVLAYGEPLAFATVFENRSDRPLSVFLPMFTDVRAFPEIRLDRIEADGSVGSSFVQATPEFSSVWHVEEGVVRRLCGSILVLQPGERIEFPYEMWDFAEARPYLRGAAGEHKVPLEEGIYRISCSYEKKDRRVPFEIASGACRYEFEDVEGLWTGVVEAAPLTIRVDPPREVLLQIDLPRAFDPGGSVPIDVEIRNHSGDDLDAACVPVVSVGFRGAVYGKAAFSWGEQAAPLPEGGFARVRVPKGSRGRCRVDLSRLDFLCEYGPLESKGPAGVFEILSRAGSWKVFVELRFPAEARRNPLRSNEQYFYLREPPDAPIAGLLLELSADRASLLAGEPVEFLLRLRNVGALPRIVCARLEGPDLLRYHVLDLEPENKLRESKDSPSVEPRNRKDDPFADDSGEAVVVDWTSPNRDTMEPLSRSDFVELAPGRAVERRLDISRLFRRDFPAGKYLLRIRYVNRSDGLRLGLRVPASIGILTSNGIEIQVR